MSDPEAPGIGKRLAVLTETAAHPLDVAAAEADSTGELLDSNRPQIYVASLADYNAGVLHGDWIAADRDADEVLKDIGLMLQRSEQPIAEDWAIHDYSGFAELHVDEFEHLHQLTEIAKGIRVYGPAYAHWASHVDRATAADEHNFEEAFLGRFDSREALIEEWIYEQIDLQGVLDRLPSHIGRYVSFDADSWLHDLAIELDVVEAPSGEIWVFGR